MRTSLLGFLMLTMLASTTSTAVAQQPMFSAPREFVLALGDSLTFGFQQTKFDVTQDPSNFNTGYVDDFARRLTATPPGRDARVVNYGCPGESTSSFLTGPCAYHAIFGLSLHDNFDGSQIDAAEAFLAAHRGQVGPILVSLGANDILDMITACGGLNPVCIGTAFPNVLATLGANYRQVLARLRRAAPDAEIIALALYNPYAAFGPPTSIQTNGLSVMINQVIEDVAAANQVRVANPFPAFNLTPPQPTRLCFLTFFCANGDIHPTDPGYQLIADLIWTASGYARFEP
jgi:lysophospholipase L1-like esterase